ncbi:MAG TPA: hypothetical protein VFB33_12425 [Candidatus Binataceae bacterium]|jgi:Flp pilus assembly pilin Flp|nr:hypothetical protein [Candidatus Binataceae bacterium]
MNFLVRLYVRTREALATERGQTMAEYALILTCIAIVVATGYELIGQSVSSSVNGITNSLTNA